MIGAVGIIANGTIFFRSSTMDVYEAVEWWYERGHTPIPIHYASKRPKIKWGAIDGVQIARPMVNAWFKNWGNVGVLLKRGLTVVDFDDEKAWERWEKVRTLTVRTSRGYHAYFQVQEQLERSLAFNGGDIKASGYVLVPPSLHPSGRRYEIEIADDIKEIMTINELGLEGIKELSKPKWGGVERVRPAGGDSLIERIKSEYTIMDALSHVKVVGSGNGKVMAVCPFHNDTKASLEVNVREDRCYCYATGCPANDRGFDAIDVYAHLRGISNKDAILTLGAFLGVL